MAWTRSPARVGSARGRVKAGEVRIRVSTLVVHPMQDTARHDLRSPRHIPDAPCKVSRGVSTGTARYVIGPRMVDSLHGGTLPVVVLFARHGPHMQPVAYQCANLECVPPPSTLALPLSSFRPLSFAPIPSPSPSGSLPETDGSLPSRSRVPRTPCPIVSPSVRLPFPSRSFACDRGDEKTRKDSRET